MSHEVFCLACDPNQAREVVAAIKRMNIKFKNISVIDDNAGLERSNHPKTEELRNAMNGSIGGAVVGLLNGVATLMVIGAAATPGILGVALIVGFSVLGGAMFGAIIGSTGLFAKPRIPVRLEQRYQEQVSRGGVLISVELIDPKQRNRFIAAIHALTVSDIHYSGEPAA
jgi:hypothetical protein